MMMSLYSIVFAIILTYIFHNIKHISCYKFRTNIVKRDVLFEDDFTSLLGPLRPECCFKFPPSGTVIAVNENQFLIKVRILKYVLLLLLLLLVTHINDMLIHISSFRISGLMTLLLTAVDHCISWQDLQTDHGFNYLMGDPIYIFMMMGT